jgi:hypothetical protein
VFYAVLISAEHLDLRGTVSPTRHGHDLVEAGRCAPAGFLVAESHATTIDRGANHLLSSVGMDHGG